MKKIIWFVVILIAAAVFFYVERTVPPENLAPVSSGQAGDYKNISYEIEGESVLLKDGVAEAVLTPGSSSKEVTRYFGNEVKADLDNDGLEDVAFLLTRDGGGSGTFFYVAAALKKSDGYKGTNAVLLGDRIAPQTTEFRDGELIVNFAIRKQNEPMTASPSVGVSKYFKVIDGKLAGVAKQ